MEDSDPKYQQFLVNGKESRIHNQVFKLTEDLDDDQKGGTAQFLAYNRFLVCGPDEQFLIVDQVKKGIKDQL